MRPNNLRRDRRGFFGWITVGFVCSCCALPWHVAAAAEKRAAIEIGSKGVKMTVVELDEQPNRPSKVLKSAAANTTIASGVVKTGKFSTDAIK